ncbi:MAG: tetratricopeptide repeat protein [Planctomycetota bacterium]
MSSERRHELQENWLASQLAGLSKTVEPYSKVLIGGLIAVFIGLLALTVYSSGRSEARSDSTFQLLQAAGSNDAEVLASVADKYPGTSAAAWARLYQGDNLLARGVESLYEDREEAADLLDGAGSAYRQALSGGTGTAGVEKTLLSRAHYGLARVAESNGNADEAIKEYEEVIQIAESEPMVKMAQSRIDSLTTTDTKNFLSWFGEQDFSPAEPALPPALTGVETLPGDADIQLPPIEAGLETETDDLSLEMDASSEEADTDSQTEPADESSSESTDAPPETEGAPSTEVAPESEDAPESDDGEPAASEDS